MNQFLEIWSGQTGLAGTAGELTLFAIIVWTFIWKGLALWRAAREESKWWFVILLVVNTLGILEIVYLFFFSKHPWSGSPLGAKKENKDGDGGPTLPEGGSHS